MTRRKLLSTTLAALAAVSLPLSAQEKDPAKKIGIAARPNQVRGDEITPQAQAAIEKGLAFLASRQAKNGSWSEGQSGAGITGLAGLALMSGGNLPGRGKYGDNVQRAVEYVLAASQESGLIAADNSHGPMYGHGFATLFLGEVYGMTGDDDVKEKLQKAVRLIQKTQNREGGWRYQPVPYDADISVTITEIMALRVASLYYGGVFEGNDLKRGLEYLIQFVPGKGMSDSEGHYFYGHYYAVQAMFLAGGDYWAKWYPAIRDQLIARQNKTTGGWSGDVTDEYATALALIVLQMPHRYLPVFHGKGPGA
jgi:squalene cyclase